MLISQYFSINLYDIFPQSITCLMFMKTHIFMLFVFYKILTDWLITCRSCILCTQVTVNNQEYHATQPSLNKKLAKAHVSHIALQSMGLVPRWFYYSAFFSFLHYLSSWINVLLFNCCVGVLAQQKALKTLIHPGGVIVISTMGALLCTYICT